MVYCETRWSTPLFGTHVEVDLTYFIIIFGMSGGSYLLVDLWQH
jgi:hypothetical protein